MTIVYLHIGLHKTGTTSIQNSLHESRQWLVKNGLQYLDLGANHSHRLYSAFADRPEQYHRNLQKGIEGKELESFNETTRRKLAAALVGSVGKEIVISGEDISRLKLDAIDKLRRFFVEHGNHEVRIIVYIREPASVMASLAQERVKNGGLLPCSLADAVLPRFRAMTSGFLEVFGKDRVIFRKFDPVTLAGPALVMDFLTTIGRDDLSGRIPVVRANDSLSAPAVRILDQYNRLYPMYLGAPGARQRNPDSAWSVEQGPLRYLSDIEGPRFVLDAEFVRQLLEMQREDVEWVQSVSGFQFGEPQYQTRDQSNCDESRYKHLAELLHQLIGNVYSSKLNLARTTARRMMELSGPDWRLGPSITKYAKRWKLNTFR